MDEIRILIVGAYGLIGHSLIDYLDQKNKIMKKKKYLVFALFRTAQALNDFADKTQACFLCDATDPIALECIIIANKIDFVINTAGVSTVSSASAAPDSSYATNISITGAICSACASSSTVRGILLTSTALIYQGSQNNLCKESDTIDPRFLTPYVKSKYCSELRAWDFPNLPIVIMRLSNIYGPSDRQKRLIPCTIKRLLSRQSPEVYIDASTGRSAQVDYLFIDDLMEAFEIVIKAIDNKKITLNQCKIFNFGSGIKHYSEEIVNILIQEVGINLQPIYISQNKSFTQYPTIDLQKTENELEFHAKTDIIEGLRKTVIGWNQLNKEEK